VYSFARKLAGVNQKCSDQHWCYLAFRVIFFLF